jgi:PST family polysaccharide transporter
LLTQLAPQESLGKTAKKGVVWSFLREGVSEILLFPASMILARLLSPEEFGIAAAAGFFTLLSGRLSELGFNAAIVRSKTVLPIHLSTVFVVNLGVGVMTFATLTAIAPLVSAFYDTPETSTILKVAAFSFLIAPFGAVPAALLARNMQFRQCALIDWYQGLTFSIVTLLLAWAGLSYMSLVYGKVAAVAVQTACRLAYARWRPATVFSKAALYEIVPFGAGMHAKRLLDYTAQNIDNLVVGKFLGMTALGLYDKAFSTVFRVLARINTGGPTVTFRVFAIIHEEPERFRRAYHKVLMSASLVAFPVFAALMAMAPQLMVVLFGERWLAAAVPFQVLCGAGALKLLNTYASSATQAAGRVWSEVWRQTIFAALIVTGIFVLRAWGPIGAAAGVLFASSVMTVSMHVLLKRVTHLRWSDMLRPLAPALLCAAGTTIVVLTVEHGLSRAFKVPGAWLLVTCQGLAAATFYSIFVLFAPHADLRALVREITSDLAPVVIKRQPWVQRYLKVQTAAPHSSTLS